MPDLPAPADRPLRVASYNIRGLKDDATAVATVIRAIDPDVLLLQELPRYPGSDYAISALARATGLLWSGRTRFVAGTGVMTSVRVQSCETVDRKLPVGLRENPRGYTVGHARLPGLPPVTIASVHLSLRADQRLTHCEQITTDLTDEPLLVLGGDLNEDRTAAARTHLLGQLEEITPDVPTFPSAKPRTRIDAILARGHREAVPGDPALLEGLPLVEATDHLPVWVDLRL